MVFLSLFGSTLVVKIKKKRNPLRAFSVMPKKNNEDKENMILLGPFPPSLVNLPPGTDARSQG